MLPQFQALKAADADTVGVPRTGLPPASQEAKLPSNMVEGSCPADFSPRDTSQGPYGLAAGKDRRF